MRIESIAYSFMHPIIRALFYHSLCTFQALLLLNFPNASGAAYLGYIHGMMLREFTEWTGRAFLEAIPVPAWPAMTYP